MASFNGKKDRMRELLSNVPKGVPVIMLNMLQFRKTANYPDDRPVISGKEAYAIYSEGASEHVKEIGGRMIWFGKAHASFTGPTDETWDHIFLVWYPSVEKFVEMIGRDSYKKLLVHRSAALKDSRLIATTERASNGMESRRFSVQP